MFCAFAAAATGSAFASAIREKAVKVLLAATPYRSNQGVRNEITIATQTARKIGDNHFIVPLRLLRSMLRCKSHTSPLNTSIFRRAGRTD